MRTTGSWSARLLVAAFTVQRISELSDDGTLLFDATLPDVSYHAVRLV